MLKNDNVHQSNAKKKTNKLITFLLAFVLFFAIVSAVFSTNNKINTNANVVSTTQPYVTQSNKYDENTTLYGSYLRQDAYYNIIIQGRLYRLFFDLYLEWTFNIALTPQFVTYELRNTSLKYLQKWDGIINKNLVNESVTEPNKVYATMSTVKPSSYPHTIEFNVSVKCADITKNVDMKYYLDGWGNLTDSYIRDDREIASVYNPATMSDSKLNALYFERWE